MHFQLTDDQRALKAGVRELLEGRFGRERLRAAVDDPRLDRGLWRELGDAGFFALRLPEADGGVGLGLPEAVLAFEEAGRVLLPGPLVATHLAAGEVAGAATGEAVVTTAYGGLVEWLVEADVVRGEVAGAGDVTAAEARASVESADSADSARPGESVESVASGEPVEPVESAGSGESVEPVEPVASVDPLTPLHRVRGFQGPDGSVDPLAVLLTAAEQLGTAARTCELAVQHARTREQFGRPIGAFQAVQHLCAQMLVRVEMARVAVYAAAVTVDPLDIASARLLADEAAVRGARDCLQVHGGMGFTWESDVHLYLKRAWVRTQRAGAATLSEEVLAAELGAGTA